MLKVLVSLVLFLLCIIPSFINCCFDKLCAIFCGNVRFIVLCQNLNLLEPHKRFEKIPLQGHNFEKIGPDQIFENSKSVVRGLRTL